MAVLELSMQAETEGRDRPVEGSCYGESAPMVGAIDGDTLRSIRTIGIVSVVATGRLEVAQM